jgi:hypothetical protein
MNPIGLFVISVATGKVAPTVAMTFTRVILRVQMETVFLHVELTTPTVIWLLV